MSWRVTRRSFWQSVRVIALASALLTPRALVAQTPGAPPPAETPAPAEADPDDSPRFFDTVTVSATLNASSIRETPGTVSVIDASAIQRRLVENIADLVKFEPGVYIETVPTGVGLNGFNIRGIGGNRVMTQIDGVETAEQFDFGPFNMHQHALDLDTLQSAEIVRSAGSSLYGSDALGGVVSFFTKDPADYLAGRSLHIGGKTSFDGRSGDTSGNFVVAAGGRRVQTSLFVSHGRGHELANKGEVRTADSTRTAPNSQDRTSTQALGKMVFTVVPGNVLRAAVEIADSHVETQAFSARGVTVAGPTRTTVSDVVADDTMVRRRVSIDHSIANRIGFNHLSWSAFVQRNEVDQVIDEVRATTGAGLATTVNREGTMDYEQKGYGATAQGRKAYAPRGHSLLFTFGGSFKEDTFDALRDRVDVNIATGAVVPPSIILPSKYFPRSEVAESGVYLQAEMRMGRVLFVPGVRYDHFSLDADQNDPVYIANQNPVPADFSAGAMSSKLGVSVDVTDHLTLHSQYAGGFRAPPYSAVNSGFTNLLGGYTALPNPELGPETSNNFDFGVRASGARASVGATGFVNRYDDFIDMVPLGVNPTTGLLEYQNQNVAKVTISGVELQGEANLSASWRLRASYAVIRGDDVSGDEDLPLTSIAPDHGAIGLQFTRPSRRWGADLSARLARGQSTARAGEGMFAPAAYGVVDALGWVGLGRSLTLRAGVLNLTNATYYEWPNVRGRAATTGTLERYTSPGISGITSLSYGW